MLTFTGNFQKTDPQERKQERRIMKNIATKSEQYFGQKVQLSPYRYCEYCRRNSKGALPGEYLFENTTKDFDQYYEFGIHIKFKTCGRCKRVFYCSKECQKNIGKFIKKDVKIKEIILLLHTIQSRLSSTKKSIKQKAPPLLLLSIHTQSTPSCA